MTNVNNDNLKIPLSTRPPRAQQLQPNKYAHVGNEAPEEVYESIDCDEDEVHEEPATTVERIQHVTNGDRPKVCCLALYLGSADSYLQLFCIDILTNPVNCFAH